MIKKNTLLCLPVIFVFALTTNVCAQYSNSPTPFYNYYYDYKLANPAFTGTKGKHVINTTYAGASSDIKGAPRLFYGSYEANITSAKSGIGGMLMFEEIAATTLTHLGVLFNKRLPFNEKSGLYIGTQVFYQSLEVDYSYYQFLDGGDPLLVDGMETTRSVDMDLGVLYYSPLVNVGASVKGIRDRLEAEKPLLNVIVAREFNITEGLKVNPSAFFFTDFNHKSFHLNSTFEIKKWVLLGAGYRFTEHGTDNLTFNAGLNIKDWVQVITHVYSSAWRGSGADAWIETMIRVTIPERAAETK